MRHTALPVGFKCSAVVTTYVLRRPCSRVTARAMPTHALACGDLRGSWLAASLARLTPS